ncbi:hypothetical protein BC832DRAFT_460685 [Gaertneriomyces semiglobifer]|nr:hypothetical protein BC832DRAFT_460685 [Gaertneriomyces semiglobifer]
MATDPEREKKLETARKKLQKYRVTKLGRQDSNVSSAQLDQKQPLKSLSSTDFVLDIGEDDVVPRMMPATGSQAIVPVADVIEAPSVTPTEYPRTNADATVTHSENVAIVSSTPEPTTPNHTSSQTATQTQTDERELELTRQQLHHANSENERLLLLVTTIQKVLTEEQDKLAACDMARRSLEQELELRNANRVPGAFAPSTEEQYASPASGEAEQDVDKGENVELRDALTATTEELKARNAQLMAAEATIATLTEQVQTGTVTIQHLTQQTKAAEERVAQARELVTQVEEGEREKSQLVEELERLRAELNKRSLEKQEAQALMESEMETMRNEFDEDMQRAEETVLKYRLELDRMQQELENARILHTGEVASTTNDSTSATAIAEDDPLTARVDIADMDESTLREKLGTTQAAYEKLHQEHLALRKETERLQLSQADIGALLLRTGSTPSTQEIISTLQRRCDELAAQVQKLEAQRDNDVCELDRYKSLVLEYDRDRRRISEIQGELHSVRQSIERERELWRGKEEVSKGELARSRESAETLDNQLRASYNIAIAALGEDGGGSGTLEQVIQRLGTALRASRASLEEAHTIIDLQHEKIEALMVADAGSASMSTTFDEHTRRGDSISVSIETQTDPMLSFVSLETVKARLADAGVLWARPAQRDASTNMEQLAREYARLQTSHEAALSDIARLERMLQQVKRLFTLSVGSMPGVDKDDKKEDTVDIGVWARKAVEAELSVTDLKRETERWRERCEELEELLESISLENRSTNEAEASS